MFHVNIYCYILQQVFIVESGKIAPLKAVLTAIVSIAKGATSLFKATLSYLLHQFSWEG